MQKAPVASLVSLCSGEHVTEHKQAAIYRSAAFFLLAVTDDGNSLTQRRFKLRLDARRQTRGAII